MDGLHQPWTSTLDVQCGEPTVELNCHSLACNDFGNQAWDDLRAGCQFGKVITITMAAFGPAYGITASNEGLPHTIN